MAVAEFNDDIVLLGQMQLLEGQQLKVIEGDISTLEMDAVVHPTSESMYPSGQVGTALLKVGGNALQAAITARVKSGTLAVTEAAITEGGDLPARNVIHVHSPKWDASNSERCLDQLGSSVISCLEVAKQNGSVRTLAFPSIGSGGNNFPKEKAARKIMRTLKAYFSREVSCVEEIFFVLFDQESLGIYKTELGRLRIHGDAD